MLPEWLGIGELHPDEDADAFPCDAEPDAPAVVAGGRGASLAPDVDSEQAGCSLNIDVEPEPASEEDSSSSCRGLEDDPQPDWFAHICLFETCPSVWFFTFYHA